MEAQKQRDFLFFSLIYQVSERSFSHTHTHTHPHTHTHSHVFNVLPCPSGSWWCNIICCTFLSPGEFCSLRLSHRSCSLHTQVCQTGSWIKLHLRHTDTHPYMRKLKGEGSSLIIHTQHRFMKWHLCVCVKQGCNWPQASPCGFQVASPSLCLPLSLPLALPLSFSFSLFLTSFCLLSRWYISCSWHGFCIAYG